LWVGPTGCHENQRTFEFKVVQSSHLDHLIAGCRVNTAAKSRSISANPIFRAQVMSVEHTHTHLGAAPFGWPLSLEHT